MKGKTFAMFVAPSLAMMFVFIALPLASVFWQSFHETRAVVTQRRWWRAARRASWRRPARARRGRVPKLGADGKASDRDGLRRVRCLSPRARDGHAVAKGLRGGRRRAVGAAQHRLLEGASLYVDLHAHHVAAGDRPRPHDRARRQQSRQIAAGPAIFVTLLPFIITPVIGALAIRWLFLGDGILTRAIEWVMNAAARHLDVRAGLDDRAHDLI